MQNYLILHGANETHREKTDKVIVKIFSNKLGGVKVKAEHLKS